MSHKYSILKIAGRGIELENLWSEYRDLTICANHDWQETYFNCNYWFNKFFLCIRKSEQYSKRTINLFLEKKSAA